MKPISSSTSIVSQHPGDGGRTNWSKIRRISALAFIDAVQFTCLSTLYPYLKQLGSLTIADQASNLNCYALGASGLGEAIFAPLFGMWTNRSGRVNPPIVTSMVVSMLANTVFFLLNQLSPDNHTTLFIGALLVARFLAGAESGNRASFFAYAIAASSSADRAQAMTFLGGSFLVGLTLGPVIQSGFSRIVPHGGFVLFGTGLHLTQYTTMAILAFCINAACTVFLLTSLDDRLDVQTASEVEMSEAHGGSDAEAGQDSSSATTNNRPAVVKMCVVAALICMCTRSARMFIQSTSEGIAQSYFNLVFGMDAQAMIDYNSGLAVGVSMVYIGMLIVYGATSYTRRVSSRNNCIIALALLLLFFLTTFSWPFLPGRLARCAGKWWCPSARPINVYFYTGTYLLCFGVAMPILNISLQTLLSQVLGSGPQGFMQGVNIAVGSFSRVLGPIIIGASFDRAGPVAPWAINIGVLTLFLVVWAAAYKRMVPVG